MSIIFKESVTGRKGVSLPESDVPLHHKIENTSARVMQIFVNFQNFRLYATSQHCPVKIMVLTQFLPAWFMYNEVQSKFTRKIAALEGFSSLHPLLPQLRRGGMLTQGALAVLYELEQQLCEITGMDAFTTHPMAGAHGELTGMMLVAAYHRKKGNKKAEVLIPDEAHGTNPSSASIAGFEVKSIPTGDNGILDISALEEAINEKTAAIMLTNPNTLGLFNPYIEK